MPAPYLDPAAAERLFRHRVLTFLKAAGAISEERIELLLSWRHSGLSVDLSVRVEPGNAESEDRVARSILRSPLSLERLELDGGARRGRTLEQPCSTADECGVRHFAGSYGTAADHAPVSLDSKPSPNMRQATSLAQIVTVADGLGNTALLWPEKSTMNVGPQSAGPLSMVGTETMTEVSPAGNGGWLAGTSQFNDDLLIWNPLPGPDGT